MKHPKHLYWAWTVALVLGPACLGADASTEDEAEPVAATSQELGFTPRGDRSITSLATGRLTKVPATEPYWFDQPFTPASAASSVSFRTTLCDSLDDTVLLVRWVDPATGKTVARFNDDAPSGQTDTLTAKNSFLNTGALGTTQPVTFQITAASRKQTTARCQLQMNQNGVWSNLGTAKHVIGGLLVDVGALQQNDFIEVQTRKDGTLGWYIDRTNLMLFDIGQPAAIEDARTTTYASRYTPYYAYGQDADNDPKITISGQDRSDVRSYVILGKVGSGTAENRNVLYWVDLLHGPFRTSMRRAPWLNANGQGGATDWVVLTPGRYLAAVQARVPMVIGECSAAATEPLCQETGGIKRGRLNDRAFSYTVERNDLGPIDASAQTLQTREVPLGAFGMKNAYHRFYLEFDVPVTGHYRFSTARFASDVSFDPAAGVEVVRNLAASELKVASTNVFYHDNGPWPDGLSNASGELENAAHLLMLRGAIDKAGKRVTQKPADAIEMQADVVVMTEVAGEDNFHRTRDEANGAGSLRWNYKVTVDEDMAGSGNGWGGVFVNDHFWPDYDNENSILRPAFYSSTYNCESGSNGCSIYAGGNGGFGTDLDAVPVKMVMDRRGDSPNIPVVVVESHFTLSGGAGGRKNNANATVAMLTQLQEKEPLAFNRNGSTSPADPDTRIIVVGDLNMNAELGEAYQIIATLRANYGFAVDAAQAVSAMGLGTATPSGGSIYGNYGGYNYSSAIETQFPYDPAPYETFEQWDDLSEASKYLVPYVNRGPLINQYTVFPWWAASWHTGRNRLDGIMLVGRGWLKDDAVRDYLVTQINPDNTQGDADRANPFRVYTEDGQPIATCLKPLEDLARNPCHIGAPYVGYQPPFVPHGQGAAGLPGDMPMNTDHKPIMARVRAIGDVLAQADRLYFKRQKRFGSAGATLAPQKGQDVAYDAAGGKVIVGTFGAGGMPAMGGACTTALTYAGGTGSDLYIAKLDAENACVWQKRIGGTGDNRAWSVALDAAGGVYVSGGFAGTVDFNPGAGTNSFSAVGGGDAFLTKLDGAGNWMWTRTVGDAGSDFGSGVAVDFTGKIWWAGYFNWASSVTRTVGACAVTGTGTGDSFWAAFDAAGTAQTLPGQCGALTGPGNQYVYAIGASATGSDVVLAGMYDTAFTAGTKPIATPVGGYDVFTYGLQGPAKNNAGFFGSAGWDQANSITVDYANYYVGGFVSGSVSNFGGNCAASSGGGQDGLVVKFFDSGACLWTSRVGGAAADWVQDIALTPTGVVALGTYQSASVVAGPRTHTLPATGLSDALLYTIDPVDGAVVASRSFEYVTSATGVPMEGRGLAAWTSGGLTRVAATGYFSGELDTGAGPLARLNAGGDFNVFVSEYENP